MRKSRFSEEQIIGILKEHQAGIGAKELCRKHGVSDGTFYKWRSKYGGMEVSEAKRLKALEAENAKLKKMLAEQMLDVAMLKEMLGKTSEARCKATRCGPGHDREKLQPAAGLRPGRDRSARLSAGSSRPADAGLRERLNELSSERRSFGYRRLHLLLDRERLEGELEEALPDLPRRRLNSP
jgi:putative transposase